MACSKPVRVPREWTKFMKEATSAPIDKELLGLQEMIDWAAECELGDEELVKKYCQKIRPYIFMRCLYPIIPDDTMCRELFKLFVHFILFVFISDDKMELQSEEEVRNMCVGFAQLDDHGRESFPEFPTVEEMKKIVRKISIPSIVGPTVFFGDFLNKMSSVLLKHGNYSRDVVYDFRLRTSNMILLYIQAVAMEKPKEKQGTVLEVFWRRIFGGCAFTLPLFAEAFSGALGTTKQHVGVITEIVLYSNMFAIAVNDLFSYLKEKDTISDNIFVAILAEKEEENISGAAEKIAQISEAILKCTYEKIQKHLKRHPGIPELRSVFDYLGRCTAGWLWAHCFVVPRYVESSLKFTLVEVDSDHLSTWLSEKPNYGDGVTKDFLDMVNQRMADVIMDAFCGAFPIHKKKYCI